MGSIYAKTTKAGNKFYYCRYKDADGHWRSKAGGTLKKDAEKVLHKLEEDVKQRRLGLIREITFSEVARFWLEDVAKVTVKKRTYMDYEQVLRNHLVRAFGSYLLSNMTPERIQKYIVRKTGEGLSARTVNKTIRVLSMILKQAVGWGYLDRNPCQFVKRAREVKREMEFLTPAEMRRLIDAASPEYRALIATACFTGARQGELFALRWSDFDTDSDLLKIRFSYHPEYGKLVEPKSHKSKRDVKVTPELKQMLFDHWICQTAIGRGDPSNLMFSNQAGNYIHRSNFTIREFFPALERAGLRRVRFHDLRHSYAAMMISLGVHAKWLQEKMGHSSIMVTMDTYGHLLPDDERDIGLQMDELIFARENVVEMPAQTAPCGCSVKATLNQTRSTYT